MSDVFFRTDGGSDHGSWRGIISVLDRRESEGEYPAWESGSHLSAQCGLAKRGQTSFKGKTPNGGKFCSREIMFRFQIMRVLVIYFGMRNAFLTRSLQGLLYTKWRWDLKCFACKIVVSDIVYHHTVLRISLPRLHCSLLVSPTISGRAVSLSHSSSSIIQSLPRKSLLPLPRESGRS